MKLTDLRPGYLYGFLQRLDYDSSNSNQKWEEELEEQKNEKKLRSKYLHVHHINVLN